MFFIYSTTKNTLQKLFIVTFYFYSFSHMCAYRQVMAQPRQWAKASFSPTAPNKTAVPATKLQLTNRLIKAGV
jgi:hypothetical protein